MKNYREILINAIKLLGAEEVAFCNEGDFVHAVVSKLYERVKLEYPIQDGRIDMVIFDDGDKTPCEFKYKKKKCVIYCDNQQIKLTTNGAFAKNEQKFLDDIKKLKSLVDNSFAKVGYAIFLTNDDRYFNAFNNSQYNICWQDYCVIGDTSFKFTICEIT